MTRGRSSLRDSRNAPASFRVRGCVRDAATARPARDLVVRAYDADAVSDDLLGQSRTDADGLFAIVYQRIHFRDLAEARPDLYLVVLDATGKRVLLSTRAACRRNAGADEVWDLSVPPETDAA